MKTLKTILSFPQAIISVTLAHVFMLAADLLAVLTRGAYGIGDFFQTEAENAAKSNGKGGMKCLKSLQFCNLEQRILL